VYCFSWSQGCLGSTRYVTHENTRNGQRNEFEKEKIVLLEIGTNVCQYDIDGISCGFVRITQKMARKKLSIEQIPYGTSVDLSDIIISNTIQILSHAAAEAIAHSKSTSWEEHP
jgi:hypothetical protein